MSAAADFRCCIHTRFISTHCCIVAMEDEEALHRCVTRFMLNTCRSSVNEHATWDCFVRLIFNRITTDITDGHQSATNMVIPFLSGSSAEFYIKPMLSCIGDIDIMYYSNDIMAISREHSAPIKLLDFARDVILYEIFDSEKPGYVSLQFLCTLRQKHDSRYVAEKIKSIDNLLSRLAAMKWHKTVHDEKETFFQQHANRTVSSDVSVQWLLTPVACDHGPAMKASFNKHVSEFFTPTHASTVDCVFLCALSNLAAAGRRLAQKKPRPRLARPTNYWLDC